MFIECIFDYDLGYISIQNKKETYCGVINIVQNIQKEWKNPPICSNYLTGKVLIFYLWEKIGENWED